MFLRTFAVIAVLAVLHSPLLAVDRTEVSGKILPTLAAVIATLPDNTTSAGTAFCFWSTDRKSYFLTNKHVIAGAREIRLKLQALVPIIPFERRQTLFNARLFPASIEFANVDLAVLVVDVGRLPHVIFSGKLPSPGQEIGVAGFPSFRFSQATSLEDLNPSVHFGTINSPAGRDYIEFDALADHGNSGGPLFDANTGYIYGVVTLGIQSRTSQAVQNNLAYWYEIGYIDSVFLPYTESETVFKRFIHTVYPCGPSDVRDLRLRPDWQRRQFCSMPDAVLP